GARPGTMGQDAILCAGDRQQAARHCRGCGNSLREKGPPRAQGTGPKRWSARIAEIRRDERRPLERWPLRLGRVGGPWGRGTGSEAVEAREREDGAERAST